MLLIPLLHKNTAFTDRWQTAGCATRAPLQSSEGGEQERVALGWWHWDGGTGTVALGQCAPLCCPWSTDCHLSLLDDTLLNLQGGMGNHGCRY